MKTNIEYHEDNQKKELQAILKHYLADDLVFITKNIKKLIGNLEGHDYHTETTLFLQRAYNAINYLRTVGRTGNIS